MPVLMHLLRTKSRTAAVSDVLCVGLQCIARPVETAATSTCRDGTKPFEDSQPLTGAWK